MQSGHFAICVAYRGEAVAPVPNVGCGASRVRLGLPISIGVIFIGCAAAGHEFVCAVYGRGCSLRDQRLADVIADRTSVADSVVGVSLRVERDRSLCMDDRKHLPKLIVRVVRRNSIRPREGLRQIPLVVYITHPGRCCGGALHSPHWVVVVAHGSLSHYLSRLDPLKKISRILHLASRFALSEKPSGGVVGEPELAALRVFYRQQPPVCVIGSRNGRVRVRLLRQTIGRVVLELADQSSAIRVLLKV